MNFNKSKKINGNLAIKHTPNSIKTYVSINDLPASKMQEFYDHLKETNLEERKALEMEENEKQKEEDKVKIVSPEELKEKIEQQQKLEDELAGRKFYDTYSKKLDVPYILEGQGLAIFSVAGPEGVAPKSANWAYRLWCVLPKNSTQQEIKVHIEKIRKANIYANQWDFFCLDMSSWAPFPPIVENQENIIFQEKTLNEIMDANFAQQKKAREFLQKRMVESQEQNINEILDKEKSTRLREQRRKVLTQKMMEAKGYSEEKQIPKEELDGIQNMLNELEKQKEPIKEEIVEVEENGRKKTIKKVYKKTRVKKNK